MIIMVQGFYNLPKNEKTARRWFWSFLVARGGIEPGWGCL